MTAKKNPNNTDIYRAIGSLDEKVDSIHEQVVKTNGRVTRLETIESNRSAVDAYIDKEGIKTPREEQDGWTTREKALIAIIMAMLGIASAVVGGVLS